MVAAQDTVINAPKDGQNGKDGQDGQPGRSDLIVRRSEWKEGTYYYSGQPDEEILDIVKYKGFWYKCVSSHGAYGGFLSPHWKPLSWYENVATDILLADTAVIRFLQNNQLLIEDGLGNITAGISGSGDVRFWSGGATPQTATWYVTKEGKHVFAGENIVINPDGSGYFANRNIAWDKYGNCFFKGSIFNPLKRIAASALAIYLDFTSGFNLDLSNLTGAGTPYVAILPDAQPYVGAQCTLWYSHYCTRTTHYHPRIKIDNDREFMNIHHQQAPAKMFTPVPHQVVKLMALPAKIYSEEEKIEWYVETPQAVEVIG